MGSKIEEHPGRDLSPPVLGLRKGGLKIEHPTSKNNIKEANYD
jgi:hypothetical protein